MCVYVCPHTVFEAYAGFVRVVVGGGVHGGGRRCAWRRTLVHVCLHTHM
jgi:hypothetical protein